MMYGRMLENQMQHFDLENIVLVCDWSYYDGRSMRFAMSKVCVFCNLYFQTLTGGRSILMFVKKELFSCKRKDTAFI